MCFLLPAAPSCFLSLCNTGETSGACDPPSFLCGAENCTTELHRDLFASVLANVADAGRACVRSCCEPDHDPGRLKGKNSTLRSFWLTQPCTNPVAGMQVRHPSGILNFRGRTDLNGDPIPDGPEPGGGAPRMPLKHALFVCRRCALVHLYASIHNGRHSVCSMHPDSDSNRYWNTHRFAKPVQLL